MLTEKLGGCLAASVRRHSTRKRKTYIELARLQIRHLVFPGVDAEFGRFGVWSVGTGLEMEPTVATTDLDDGNCASPCHARQPVFVPDIVFAMTPDITTPHPPGPSGGRSIHRKRAVHACLPCRRRKVRSQRGSRKRLHPSSSRLPSPEVHQPSPDQLTNRHNLPAETTPSTTGVDNDTRLTGPDGPSVLDSCMPELGDALDTAGTVNGHVSDHEIKVDHSIGISLDNLSCSDYKGTEMTPPKDAEAPREMSTTGCEASTGSTKTVRRGSRWTQANATVLYSHFPYLTLGNVHNIPHQDVSYLESQGCFHVPTRPGLDDLVEQYFAHFHGLLPLLNEGDFWDMYCQKQKDNITSQDKMALLVFQAMLFASCSKNKGKRSYRAEKTETSPLSLAQSALLMGWIPSFETTLSPHKTWLGLAIQHAESINADLHTRILVYYA
ncbi:hypothetical protein BGZ61DRAFT_487522 [Ilyonectria robusta]|uniref:uncharacterized protein n=1 Tax=Ilyonectria robusta TaxID=1079257 RepID=UPI001E8E56B6|nr:uncharacterized protein BGZ61DRAFT_487522 [Ilyonectria robusta]KAH8652018.1 hypothetical protein BGZ61DRAFT_487522 [Ilyonectria robusta]